eukprot:TRINITY_DN4171_c0_g1_i1.p1 TRINITY_DN4171_c0_g1~~TRINITY_DN4171_c0_g1_i1.p1  ORF type:complete len:179 (-),score=20.04 TRINITY_DN4171_c0_g1_i1:84-620(-)
MNSLLLTCLAIFASVALATSPEAAACKFTDSTGYTFDFSSLTSNSSSGYLWTSAFNNSNYLWQLNVCANVAVPKSSACGAASPGYSLNLNTGTCLYLGDVNVYAFDTTPENDGVMLTYYHGQYVNDITSITARIYFVCQATPDAPSFEHVRLCTDPDDGLQVGWQYHFFYPTPLACKK